MKNAFKTLNTPFMNANMLIACMLPFADRAALPGPANRQPAQSSRDCRGR